MRWMVLFAAFALAGCSKSGSAQTAYNLANDALAQAERANNRADMLEAQVSDLESKIEDLRAAIQNEASERERSDANLEMSVQNHMHY